MVRPLRLEYAGAVYHVTSRGNDRQAVFLSDRDRELFLDILDETVGRQGWLCHAYCLMDNHYHLLIETPLGELSKGMMRLNQLYTQKFNRLHGRVGHLFQGRYKRILVEKESHLLEVARYIVLNPVRARIATDPSEWKWSSYRATAGRMTAPGYLMTEWVLGRFGKSIKTAHRGYVKFVMEGIEKDELMKGVKGGLYLGGEGFIERLKELLEPSRELDGVPRYQRHADRPSLLKLFKGVSKLSLEERNVLIIKAVIDHGYSQAKIVSFVGLHYSTISRIVGRKK